jgi:hypothetical protein
MDNPLFPKLTPERICFLRRHFMLKIDPEVIEIQNHNREMVALCDMALSSITMEKALGNNQSQRLFDRVKEETSSKR